MDKTIAVVSQSQVLITTPSLEEAVKLADAARRYTAGEIDDALNRLPAVELELKAQQELVADLQAQLKKLKLKSQPDLAEPKVEKTLGSSKKKK